MAFGKVEVAKHPLPPAAVPVLVLVVQVPEMACVLEVVEVVSILRRQNCQLREKGLPPCSP